MPAAVLLALLALAAPTQGAAPKPGAAQPARDEMGAAEQEFCASELEVLERRKKLFESQGLSPAEVTHKNQAPIAELTDCRKRWKAEVRRAAEQQADQKEAERRAGPNPTPLERDRAWKEVRRERLASKDPATLSAAEKAELAAGMKEELEATHQALDTAHQRSPAFMRVVHSAIACYHLERKGELTAAIASEENLVKLGTGDRNKLYTMKSELRTSDEILARNAEVARSLPNGLDRCTTPTVAVVSRCLAVTGPEPACESEEVQQYVRFVK